FEATNILNPLGVLITGIQFDHEQYLGESLQSIAREKAGIFRSHVPAVLGPMPRDIAGIFEDHAQALHAPVFRFGQEFSISETGLQEFSYEGQRWTLPKLHTNLLGRHQLLNASNALALLETAVDQPFPLSETSIRE